MRTQLNISITLLICLAYINYGLPKGYGKALAIQSAYWVILDSKVIKIDGNGQTLATYSNHLLGAPTSIDPSDPFRVLIFYQQHQAIVLINTHGVAIGQPIYFTALNLGEITLACRSSRGGAWLYHRETNELLLTNPQFSTIEQRITVRDKLAPSHLTEVNNKIYLGFENSSILRFDSYGVEEPALNILFSKWFLVSNEYVWVYYDGIIRMLEIQYPHRIVGIFNCNFNTIPLVINGEAYFYDGIKLIQCKKLVSNTNENPN